MEPFETARLRLRPIEARDKAGFAAMNADPQVMEHFPAPLSRRQSDEFLARLQQIHADVGYAFAAIEARESGAFLGIAGLNLVAFDAPVRGMTEIGWRLQRAAWDRGYASEAARAWLDYGFGTLGLERIVAFTARPNRRSQAVMWRIGMERAEALDFDHPALEPGHPLRAHVVLVARRDTREA